MAGKRGRNKTKNTNMDDQSAHIGSALMPRSVFAAVPMTPLPPQVQGPRGLSRTAPPFNPPPGPPTPRNEDDMFSDPESSLYDYQQMEEPGYSSVEFGTFPRMQRRGSISERAPAPLPTTYHVLDPDAVAQEDMSELYARPMKRQNRFAQVNGDGLDGTMEGDAQASMRTTQAVQEAMRAVHDLPPEETMVKTVAMDQAHSPQRSRSIRTRGSGRGFGRRKSVQSNGPNSEPLEVREELIMAEVHTKKSASPLRSRRTVSEEEVSRARSSPESPDRTSDMRGSLSARSLGRSHSPPQGREFRDASGGRGSPVTSRSFNLEVENVRLRSSNQEMHAELTTLRKVATAMQEGDTQSAESLLLTRQLDELKRENETLQSAVQRTNAELSRYQAKYPPSCLDTAGDLQGLPSKGPVPAWLVNEKYLAPLFLAYDERLHEKDELIRKYERDAESLRVKTEDVVRENQQLHSRLEGTGSGGLGTSEWQQLQEQARLVLEENQVLMEQLDIQRHKVKDMCNAHMQEVSKLAKRLSATEGEKVELEKEAEEVKAKLKEFKTKYESLALESQTHMTMEKHITVIQDLKRTVVEEKETAGKEVEETRGRLRAAEEEQRQLARQLADSHAENRRLAVEVKSYQKALRKMHQKVTVLLRAMEQSEGKEMVTQEQLAKVIRVAEKTALERDTMAKVAKERAFENERALERFLESTVAVGKLEEKLKLCKLKAAANINTISERLKEQDEAFNSQKQEYERELTYLRRLLKEKEGTLNGVRQDKDALEEDLEVVWQAASAENQRMKDVLRKSVRRLKQHAGLKEVLDSEGEGHELLNLSSDEGA